MLLTSFLGRRTIRCLRAVVCCVASVVLLAAILLLLARFSASTNIPPTPPQSHTRNSSDRINFQCRADFKGPTYKTKEYTGLSESQVLQNMGDRVIVSETKWTAFLDQNEFSDNNNQNGLQRRSVHMDARDVQVQHGEGVKKDAEGVIVPPPKNDDSPLPPEWIPFGVEHPEEKAMEWHGFGSQDEKEDNSENSWQKNFPGSEASDFNRDVSFTPNIAGIGPSKLKSHSAVVLEPFKNDPAFSNHPRITYFNGHRGCNENLRGVLARLKINFNVLDPRKLADYGMLEKDARTLVDSGWVKALCQVSDIIIIADTVPDARAILLSLLEKDESKRCRSNIIVELTNRFDWMVGDSVPYYNMLRKLTNLAPKNLWWTANNPFEAAFFESRVGIVPNITLLRSMGAWDVDSQVKIQKTLVSRFLEATGLNWQELRWRKQIDEKSKESLCTIEDIETKERPKVGDLFDFFCMPIVPLSKRYGGPVGLLKFKGFVHIPYQASVMKFYENVAMGVPQIIPTPRLLRALGKTNNHHLFMTWLDKLEEASLFLYNPVWHKRVYNSKHSPKDRTDWDNIDAPYYATWTELADFYRKEFEPFVYQFDSFEELAVLVQRPADVFDWKNVRVEGPKYYAKVRRQSLNTWKNLLREMGHVK
ncbi:hypothetical protein HDU81_006342 [Chytriomyces hyalinus]|nr:hypothetical protein HDU81_006342 [Chytriomyces hyalinus]